MFDISYNGIIRINRGDSAFFPLFLNCGTCLNPVPLSYLDNCNIYFAVMEPNQPFESALIKKKYSTKDLDDSGNLIVELKPQDTQCVLPGKYYYQVKLQMFNSEDPSDYTVDTVVQKTQFFIME